MPEKRREEKVGDLKAQSVDHESDKVKGGAEPVNNRKVEPVSERPRPAVPPNS